MMAALAASARADVVALVEAQPMPAIANIQAASVAVSPDGAHLYVAAGRGDCVVVFERDPIIGALTWSSTMPDDHGSLSRVSAVWISPDGRFVYAVSPFDDAISVFARAPATGALTFVEALFDGVDGADGLDGAHMVTASPDGRHVYVAASSENALAVFDRDPMTGGLALAQLLRDGVDGVDGLDGVVHVALAPDGTHVYTTAYRDDALTVFERDATTGQLTFVTTYRDGDVGVEGLDGATAVEVSPEGQHVYATSIWRQGLGENALTSFARDGATGLLTLIQVQFDDREGVDGLDQASSIAIRGDGRYLFVAAVEDDALGVFRRDPATGLLTFAEVRVDGIDGADGLGWARWVALGPDDEEIYVASLADPAVSVWSFVAGCPGDLDVSGDVAFDDLLVTLAAWGPCGDECPADLDGDGMVAFGDLLLLLSSWGPCG